MQALGKQPFKRCLEPLLPVVCDALRKPEPHQRARAIAAGELVAFLRRFIGPSILAGRLSPEQNSVLVASEYVPSGGPSSGGM